MYGVQPPIRRQQQWQHQHGNDYKTGTQYHHHHHHQYCNWPFITDLVLNISIISKVNDNIVCYHELIWNACVSAAVTVVSVAVPDTQLVNVINFNHCTTPLITSLVVSCIVHCVFVVVVVFGNFFCFCFVCFGQEF